MRLSTFSTQVVLHTLQRICPDVWKQLCNNYTNKKNKKKWNANDIDDDDDYINDA